VLTLHRGPFILVSNDALRLSK